MDDAFPIRQALPVGFGFGAGLARLGFPLKELYIIVDTINLHEFHPFL